MDLQPFHAAFQGLTGNAPFPWQRALYERFRDGDFPDSCILPTGLGKTNVIAVWLIALAFHRTHIPRRLVYVVNRRTVVDQTTNEIVQMRNRLTAESPTEAIRDLRQELETVSSKSTDGPLAISTLRGQFADNREWSADPSRPAVICGTVDMIGSRLLFSGYNVGFKARPLHAGFLGQDALLVHDEAHLEPAFQSLITAIACEQQGGRLNENGQCEAVSRQRRDFRPLRVMELTATRRDGRKVFPNDAENAENEKNAEVQKRVGAKKTVKLHPNPTPEKGSEKESLPACSHCGVAHHGKLADEMAGFLLTPAIRHSKRPILVVVRKVEDVETIATKLEKAEEKVRRLTGTLRGKERDDLVKDPVFIRFLPPTNRPTDVAPEEGTVYLVCTSAGEVGVNISADHLVSDLSTFESMAQRFGRVNRFGIHQDTEIHIFYPTRFEEKDLESRRRKTLALMERLTGDGSPRALGNLPLEDCKAAFAPTPTILPATDILFDAWALTTIREKLPGRPPVEPYLHGISEYELPQTTVAWREEVSALTPTILKENRLDIEDLLAAYPLKPHEELSAPTDGKNKVFEQLEKIAARDAERPRNERLSAWVIDPFGEAKVYSLQELVKRNSQNKPVIPLGGRTVILPPNAGGLSGGLLKGDEPYSDSIPYDVSGEWWLDQERKRPRRTRAWSDNPAFAVPNQMRLICRIRMPVPDDDDDADPREWHWFTRPLSADDDGSKSSRVATTWVHHTSDVEREASRLADALLSGQPDLHLALVLASRFHDLGKRRHVWQREIGNDNYPSECFAKSGQCANGKWLRPRQIIDYRHEFGSLIDVLDESEFKKLAGKPELQELILHLVAAHHGYARPHFPAELSFDPELKNQDASRIATAVVQRFARLQREYGRWGLAYLESLLRAADWHASANPSKEQRS